MYNVGDKVVVRWPNTPGFRFLNAKKQLLNGHVCRIKKVFEPVIGGTETRTFYDLEWFSGDNKNQECPLEPNDYFWLSTEFERYVSSFSGNITDSASLPDI